MKYNPFAAAAVLAMILALGLSLRVFSQHEGFNLIVNESLKTSEGYDQSFIDLVNKLEIVLTRRASFAYPGGKDPMTGRKRELASEEVAAPKRIAAAKPAVGPAKPGNAGVTASAGAAKADTSKPAEDPISAADHVKLTAIIADDYGQHTAIVMDGERSQSVDVGDMVGNRKVVKITGKEITMENDSTIYTYDLSGNRSHQKK